MKSYKADNGGFCCGSASKESIARSCRWGVGIMARQHNNDIAADETCVACCTQTITAGGCCITASCLRCVGSSCLGDTIYMSFL